MIKGLNREKMRKDLEETRERLQRNQEYTSGEGDLALFLAVGILFVPMLITWTLLEKLWAYLF